MKQPSPVTRIGVFDSGIGGLTVLRALRHALPRTDFVYVADTAHAPYGENDVDTVRQRSRRIARFMRVDQGCGLLVVACNTATALAVSTLRAEHPDWPIVGVEPAIKPAAAQTRNGRVGVLATEATLHSARFEQLAAEHASHITLYRQACPGLAAAIEHETPAGSAAATTTHDLVERYVAPLRAADCDVVVLGCTHYPVIAPLIGELLGPDVTLIDTADAVARRVAALAALPAADAQGAGRLTLWSSGSVAALSAFALRWLGHDAEAHVLPV